MKVKKYEFLVGLCGGWANGTITVEALDYKEAYEKVEYRVTSALNKGFPTLDITYDIEPAKDYSEEWDEDDE